MTTRAFGGLLPHMNNAPTGLVPHLSYAPMGMVSQNYAPPSHDWPIPSSPQAQLPSAPVGHLQATWTTPPTPTSAVDLSALDQYGPQMKAWAEEAVKYGNEAGVDPDLVLAMALQEGAPLRTGLDNSDPNAADNLLVALRDPATYASRVNPNGPEAGILYDQFRYDAAKVHADHHTKDQLTWHNLINGHIFHAFENDPGNSIGLTNMKEDQFNQVRDSNWQLRGYNYKDLIGNDDLAMQMTAYNLKMLYEQAAILPTTTAEVRSTPLDQFLGSGYNAGGMLDRSQSVADGRAFFTGAPQNPGTDHSNETQHGEATVGVVEVAHQILYGSGAYA